MTEALQLEIRTLRALLDSERDPAGRAFAPLADAYRRAGQIPEAMRLLRDGIAKHPDFATGHVVAAQLYVEQGLAAEAAIAARRALELDGENVNALGALLRALEETGDTAEAERVRSLLTTLEPDFTPDWEVRRRAPSAAEPSALAATGDLRAFRPEASSGVSAEPPSDGAIEVGFDLKLEEPAAPPKEVAPSGGGMIDLSTIGPLPLADVSPSAFAPDLPPAPADVPLDLELVGLDLPGDAGPGDATGTAEPTLEEPGMELAALAPEGADEEPVMDLPLLSTDDAEEEEEAVLDVATLAPEEEPVLEIATLAPEATEEEPVMDLPLLSTGHAEEEAVLDVSALAPDEEPVMEIAALAPDAADADEEVMDLALLAPDEEPVMDIAALAPEAAEEEPVMDVALLAPDDESVVDLASLAPDAPDEEPVMDIAALAPEPAEDEQVMDVAQLAPDEEPVMDLPLLSSDDGIAEARLDAAALERAGGVEERVFTLDALAPEGEGDYTPTRASGMTASGAGGDNGQMSVERAVDVGFAAPDEPSEFDLDALRAEHTAISSGPPPTGRLELETAAVEPGAGGETDVPTDDGGEPIFTRTLAELYADQGAVKEAITVLRHLQEENPQDESLSRRIAELEAGGSSRAARAEEPEEDDEVETAARELAESGRQAKKVDSLYAWTEREPAGAADAGGPTIREYFDGLLDWEPRDS